MHPGGAGKFLRKYAAFSLLVIDEWVLDRPTEAMRKMLLEFIERRYGETSTVFCTQYQHKVWPQRLGAGVHADAIQDRIIHNAFWVDTGIYNMHEHTALITAYSMRESTSGAEPHHHWCLTHDQRGSRARSGGPQTLNAH